MTQIIQHLLPGCQPSRLIRIGRLAPDKRGSCCLFASMTELAAMFLAVDDNDSHGGAKFDYGTDRESSGRFAALPGAGGRQDRVAAPWLGRRRIAMAADHFGPGEPVSHDRARSGRIWSFRQAGDELRRRRAV